MERRPYLSVAQERDPPLVSGRWRVLGAALRRAIASRRAVPANVKDQSYHPLHPSSHGECEKVYPIPPPLSSGKCSFWKFAGILIPRKLRKQVSNCFRAFINSRWDCARGRSSGVFGHAPPRWRLSMRREQDDQRTSRRGVRPKSQKSRMAAIDDHAIRAKDSLQSPAQQASCQTDRYGARAEQTTFEHDQN